jgi:hypothetical protein
VPVALKADAVVGQSRQRRRFVSQAQVWDNSSRSLFILTIVDQIPNCHELSIGSTRSLLCALRAILLQ